MAYNCNFKSLNHANTIHSLKHMLYRCIKALRSPENVKLDIDNTDGHVDGDLSLVDNDGNTALHLACLNGHLRVVDYLCTSGAELEAW